MNHTINAQMKAKAKLKTSKTLALLALSFVLVTAGAVGCGKTDGNPSQQAVTPAAVPTPPPPVAPPPAPTPAPQPQYRFVGRMDMSDRQGFALMLEDRSKRQFCATSLAFGSFNCSAYSQSATIEIITPAAGQTTYFVNVGLTNAYFAMPIQMSLYPTGDGFTLQENVGLRDVMLRAPLGNFGDKSIAVTLIYKNKVLGTTTLSQP